MALVGVLSAACVAQEVGQPSGTSGSPKTGSSSASSAPSSSAMPPRPKEIKLEGVDPCKLWTPDQMAQLGVVKGERNDSNVVNTGKVPICDYTGDLTTNYGLGAIATQGVEYWTGTGNTDVSVIDVAGFGAKQISLSGVDEDCAVAVDVAEGQQLYVDFIPIGSKKPAKDVMCQNVKKGAELALATLQTLK